MPRARDLRRCRYNEVYRYTRGMCVRGKERTTGDAARHCAEMCARARLGELIGGLLSHLRPKYLRDGRVRHMDFDVYTSVYLRPPRSGLTVYVLRFA